jgi:hypothetical protein
MKVRRGRQTFITLVVYATKTKGKQFLIYYKLRVHFKFSLRYMVCGR